jgi:RNA polymerase-interacting CarD/CdnL/TRCF family regulator
MSRAKVARVLDILCSGPQRLPKDFKERQEIVWEKLKTGRPTATAETVRDLSWRKESAHLTKKDSELLLRGNESLAAELALVLGTEISEAEEWISTALATAIMAGREREQSAQLA